MSLGADVLRIGDRLFTAIAEGNGVAELVSAWINVAERVELAHHGGQLLPKDAQLASTMANKVKELTGSLMELEIKSADAINDLSTELGNMFMHNDDSLEPTPKPPLRTSKRSCRPTTRRPPPSRSPSPPPPAHASTTHDPRSLPLRHWFLEHLSFPYPSPSEKIAIAADCGITRAKVDSDMTNWRRRSGWTDMMVRYSGGDRETMRVMLEQLLAGKGERVGGVADAVDGVRRYLMGEAPKPELGWIEELPVVAGRMPSTTPNPRKRRSSSEPDSSDSDESEEAYHPLPTQSRARPSAARQMPHIPSISSLSTTSTFINSDGSGKRTVSGSSRYSYATDSTFAEADEELLPKSNSTQSSLPAAEQTSAFTFTPLYASPYGLQPSTSTPQTARKRPAEAPLGPDSTKTVRRLDPSFYHSSFPSSSNAGPSSGQPKHSYIAARAISPTSSHASHASSVSASGGTETSVSSPSSVTDIENNYIPYASFTTSSHILAEASGSGSGPVPRGGGRGDGQGDGRMGSWAATAPLARPDWGVSQVRFSLPQGEYEFAPRLEGWVGGQ